MKKFKMAFAATTLLVLSVGVFAGRPKLTTNLYVSASPTGFGPFYQLLSGAIFVNLTTSTTGNPEQAQISDRNGALYYVYSTNSAPATPVYSTTAW